MQKLPIFMSQKVFILESQLTHLSKQNNQTNQNFDIYSMNLLEAAKPGILSNTGWILGFHIPKSINRREISLST